MNKILQVLTFLCIGILVFSMILNILRTAKGRDASRLFNRMLYLSGLGAVLFNGIRVCLLYQDSRATMLLANIIAGICLLIAFLRSERGEEGREE